MSKEALPYFADLRDGKLVETAKRTPLRAPFVMVVTAVVAVVILAGSLAA